MNAHFIASKYIGQTDTRSSKVKLTSLRFERDSIQEGYDYEKGNVFDQGTAMLQALGYTVICSGETPKGYVWAVAEFYPLKETARKLKYYREEAKKLKAMGGRQDITGLEMLLNQRKHLACRK